MKSIPGLERSIMFAMPAYQHMVHISTMMTIMGAVAIMTGRRWGAALESYGGHGAVHIARNFLVDRFLHSNCTDLFFIDNDIACDPEELVRMIERPVDVVLGLYRVRSPVEQYLFMMENDSIERDPDNELIPIQGGPCGFMRIKRHVLETMVRALPPEGWMRQPGHGEDSKIPGLFDFDQHNSHYVGEDVSFCMRWRAMGGKIWVDPDITLHHSGTMTFSSRFADALGRHVIADDWEHLARQAHEFERLVNGQ